MKRTLVAEDEPDIALGLVGKRSPSTIQRVSKTKSWKATEIVIGSQ
jgi:hypothetical protein